MNLNLPSNLGTSGRAASVPGTSRPTFGLSPLFFYQPHTETGVSTSGGVVTAVTGMSGSPNMTAPVSGPLQTTDLLGRKIWRFRGADYLEIAPANLTITPRSLTVLVVGRFYANVGRTQIFGQSYQTDGVTADNFNKPFLSADSNGSGAQYIGAPGDNAYSVSGGPANAMVGAQLQVMGIACNGSRTRYMMNAWAGDGAVADNFNANMKGARIGGYVAAQGTNNYFDVYAIVGFAGTLTNAEADAAAAKLVETYAVPTVTRQIIFPGDSITASSAFDATRPLAAIISDPGAGRVAANVRCVNMAFTGAQTSALIGQRDATQSYLNGALPGGATNNLICVQIGVNDRGTLTEAQAAANVVAYLNTTTTGAFQKGFRAALGYNIATENGVAEAYLANLRTIYKSAQFLIDTGTNSGGAFDGRLNRIDLQQITISGGKPFLVTQNPAYYNGDGLHPNLLGATALITGGDTPANGFGSAL